MELGHEERVAGSAAGDDELGGLVLGEDESVKGIHDAESGEDGCGTNEVFRTGTELAAFGEDSVDVGVTEVFAAGRFGRLLAEIGIAEKLFEEWSDAASALGDASVFVVTLAVVGEVLDEGVDEDVGGASVEGEDVFGLGCGGNDGDVGDAAEVEGNAAEFGVAVEEVIGEGDEWGALAADGHVGGAEVGDGGDAG